MTTALSPRDSTLVERPRTSEAAIELQGIKVRFHIPSEQIRSFKEYVLRRLTGRIEHRELRALDSVSLRVEEGEVFGIVGRNGAGKSTLLKVISRVLRPTEGRVIVRGQVAPLLELGAGFHWDLTGRENVYLNASLFGYSRSTVQENLGEVISFSGLEEFIDLPIRNYSNGMMARLGFAVATMFRPDILIIDELLAVGDVAFQQRCLDRIRRFRASGTTVLLVSHQPDDITKHCDRALWLEHGRIAAIGGPQEVIASYREALAPPTH